MDRMNELLPLILPLVIIQVVLIVVALLDLRRPERRVRGGSKVLWAVLIVVLEMLGPLLYFTVGRDEA